MGLIEALGLGSARDAKLLVARLPAGAPLTVATGDERVVRALQKAQHHLATLTAGAGADVSLALGLPDEDAGLEALLALTRATRDGGLVSIATVPLLGRTIDRARVTGLFLRAGLVDLAQDVDGGVIYTTGRVARLERRAE